MAVVTLPKDYLPFIEREIAEGRFASADAIVAEALRRMSAESERLAWLREKIAEADQSVANGEWLELDDEAWDKYFDELERRIDNQPVAP